MNEPGILLTARAMVLHDLAARGFDDAVMVSLLEDAVAGRQWWLDQWPDGAEHIAARRPRSVQEEYEDRRLWIEQYTGQTVRGNREPVDVHLGIH